MTNSDTEVDVPRKRTRLDGVAPVKAEYILSKPENSEETVDTNYDDEAEGGSLADRGAEGKTAQKGKNKKKGQNKGRKLQQPKDEIRLCPRFLDKKECEYGDSCRFEHNLDTYLKSKPEDIPGVCPVFKTMGYCPAGVKCRWLSSHYEGGALVVNEELKQSNAKVDYEVNRIDGKIQNDLQKKKYPLTKSNEYIDYLDKVKKQHIENEGKASAPDAEDNAAAYVEAPFKPLEKKKLYLNRAKIVSPLTTVGNLPYRRLMKTLGADVTYSEMALSLPLVQGAKSEWALTRAHASEIPGFGIQIAGSKYWQTTKASQLIAELAPNCSEINLNCGCPIDLLYRAGAGSALMDNPGRLMKMTEGMMAVSGDIPVTIKIRTGVRDGHPTAKTLVQRAVKEGLVSAITLHGRSRAQRYTKLANWDYIKQVAELVREERETNEENDLVKPWIIGNGDVYSWEDWYQHVDEQKVDSVMVARGALIKPWIFEEVEAKQYLDKSATERLAIVEQYCKFGLDHWGSDEYGVNQTRRFVCEFLSFLCRYIPVGILEYLPPKLNDRPPLWKGRNELETLLASKNYQDWIKITEMFLGPASKEFEFIPKHKSNSY